MQFSSMVCLFLLVSFSVVFAVKPRYQHFEDYLNNLDTNEQSWISNTVDEDPDDETNKDNQNTTSTTSSTTTTTTTTTMTPYIQESSGKNKDMTCCMLGQLAGDKGYHCYSQYYAARIVMRNRNRAHNRKMAFYGPQRIKNYGDKLMRTFEQCVAGGGVVFHKCCHLSAMERRVERYDTVQRNRYQRVRHQQQQTHQDEDDEEDDEDRPS